MSIRHQDDAFTTDLSPLIEIMATLRSPQGCPWDRAQTPAGLKKFILEETYELLEAIDTGNTKDIRDELGDVLLQVVFLTQIFSESGTFHIKDVIAGICTKMIRRHPHVFADADSEGHNERWEQIKDQERHVKGSSELLAQRLPASLPALLRCQKLIKKTAPVTMEERLARLARNQEQLTATLGQSSCPTHLPEQLIADMLYELSGLAAALKIDAEDGLRQKTTAIIAEIDRSKDSSPATDWTNS